MRVLSIVCHGVDRATRLVAGVMLGAIFLLTVVNALARYLFSYNMLWAYDWLRVLFLFFVFFSVPIIYKQKGHAKFVFLENKFPPLLAFSVRIFTYVLSAVLFAVVIKEGIALSVNTRRQVLPASGLSAMWLYIPLACGMAACLMHTVLFAAEDLRGRTQAAAMEGGRSHG